MVYSRPFAITLVGMTVLTAMVTLADQYCERLFDYLKVPYHGRESTISAAFFRVVRSRCAVITCSGKNLPDDGVLAALRDGGAEVSLTEEGSVRAVTDGRELRVTQSSPDE